MAFKGDLKNVHLADLFQTLSQNQQEGVLTIAAAGQEQRVHFHSQGITLLNPRVVQRRRLGEILIASCLITQQQLDAALREQGRTGRAIGETVVGMGLISPEELESILRVQVEEELFELFRIQIGSFEFREGAPVDGSSTHPLQFQVDGIVLEAARRMDEWSLIQEQVPELTRVYSCVDPSQPQPEDQEARVVLEHLDGRRSVQDAADALLSSPFAVAKVIASLLEEGRVREATPQELLRAGRNALAEGDQEGAAKLLNLLRQMDLTGSEEILPELAQRLRDVEDGRGAAQVRLRIARLARDRQDLASARRELERALEDQPGSHAVLVRLVEVLHDLKEPEAELECIQNLLEVLPQGADPEEAIRHLERALELDPNDTGLYRQLSDFCLRARLKDKAILVLERELDLLRQQRKPNRALVPVYKRILHIDSSRVDLEKALRRMHIGTKGRWIRLGVLVATLIGTSIGAWMYYSNSRQNEQDLEALSVAIQRYHSSQYPAARTQVQDVLRSARNDDVLNRAALLLDRIDSKISEIARKERDVAEKALETVLVDLQVKVDDRRFDLALSDLMVLLRQQQEPYLRKRVIVRLKAFSESIASRVVEVQSVASSYEQPTTDPQVERAFLLLTGTYSQEDAEMLKRLRPLVENALVDAPADAQPYLVKVDKATSSWVRTDQKMRSELAGLEEQYHRLKELQDISTGFVRGMEQARRGELVEARAELAEVLKVYGPDGSLEPVIRNMIDTLDGALAAMEEVEALVAQQDIRRAHEVALSAIAEFEEVSLGNRMLVPIAVSSSPPGALLSVDGVAMGRTPMILRVPHDQVAELVFERAGFQQASFPLQCVLPFHHQPLRMEELRQVDLGATAESAPVFHDDAWYISTRDGALFEVPTDPDRQVRDFKTGSLGGSTVHPVPTSEGVVLSVLEGRLWMLDTRKGGSLEPRWDVDLKEEVHYQPVEHLSDLVVVTDAGRLVFLDLISGNQVFETDLGGRVVGNPAILGGHLYLTLAGGVLLCYDLGGRTQHYRREVGADLDGNLQVSDESLVTCTSSGDVLRFHPRSGAEIWRVPLGSFAIGGASLHEDSVTVCLGDQIVRLALADGQRRSSWDSPVPLSTRPALSDPQTVLVGAEDGSLYAFIEGELTPFFRSPIANSAQIACPVVTDNAIAVLCRDGTFTLLAR